jgi:hypothetical protein
MRERKVVSNVWIATGVTKNYLPRAREYFDTLAKHEPKRGFVFCVDFNDVPQDRIELDTTYVPYHHVLHQPKFMLQAGSFADFAPPHWHHDDVVAFTDSDGRWQRPLSEAEIAEILQRTENGGVMIGPNLPTGEQTLAQESLCLSPTTDPDEVERRFPEQRDFLCRNTGFVIARLSTWGKLHRRYRDIWSKVDATWGNAAKVQWGICYTVQKWPELRLEPLSRLIHSQGHLGLADGLERDGNGLWTYRGELVAFAHAL